MSGTIALLSSGSATMAPTPSPIQVWISDSCPFSCELAWLSSSSYPRAWHSCCAPAISGAQIEALVSGWLKPIFFRLPEGFPDDPELALLPVLVVPQAASTGPATASAPAAAPARPRKCRRDSGGGGGGAGARGPEFRSGWGGVCC